MRNESGPEAATVPTPRQASATIVQSTRPDVKHATGPLIGGTVRVDLRKFTREAWNFSRDHEYDRAVTDLTYAPAGAAVVLVVSPRAYLPTAYLREHGQHLGSITVECSDPDTIARWVDALRSGFRVGDLG